MRPAWYSAISIVLRYWLSKFLLLFLLPFENSEFEKSISRVVVREVNYMSLLSPRFFLSFQTFWPKLFWSETERKSVPANILGLCSTKPGALGMWTNSRVLQPTQNSQLSILHVVTKFRKNSTFHKNIFLFHFVSLVWCGCWFSMILASYSIE